MNLKEFFQIHAVLAWAMVLMVVFVLFGFGLYAVLYPAQLAVERNAVEDSKSFTDATNLALVNYMQDYQKLETKIAEASGNNDLIATYRAQQRSDLDAMCQTMSRMKAGTISPLVTSFVAQHGGCK